MSLNRTTSYLLSYCRMNTYYIENLHKTALSVVRRGDNIQKSRSRHSLLNDVQTKLNARVYTKVAVYHAPTDRRDLVCGLKTTDDAMVSAVILTCTKHQPVWRARESPLVRETLRAKTAHAVPSLSLSTAHRVSVACVSRSVTKRERIRIHHIIVGVINLRVRVHLYIMCWRNTVRNKVCTHNPCALLK